MQLEWQIAPAGLTDEDRNRCQLRDPAVAGREDRVAHRPRELERIERPLDPVGIDQARHAREHHRRRDDPPPGLPPRGERARAERGVAQGERQNDRPEHEQAVRVDPEDLDHREQPGQRGILVPSKQDGQEDRQESSENVSGRTYIRPPRTSKARSQASTTAQTGQSRFRAVISKKTASAGDRALGQVQRDDPTMGVPPAQRDLETPVQVDPGAVEHGERVEVGLRDLAGLADQVAGAEVPPEVGVLQREDAEQEGQRQERGDQAPVEQPEPHRGTRRIAGRGRLGPRAGLSRGRPLRKHHQTPSR